MPKLRSIGTRPIPFSILKLGIPTDNLRFLNLANAAVTVLNASLLSNDARPSVSIGRKMYIDTLHPS